MIRFVHIGVALAFLSVGCIGGRGSSASEPPETPFVVVSPEDARLVAASQGLATSVGHSMNYDVDAALLKEHAPHIYEILAHAIETSAQGIAAARASSPEVTARACLVVTTLKIELDERARQSFAYVDWKAGMLVLRVPTSATSFTTEQNIVTAFVDSEPPEIPTSAKPAP